jgi:hypothetical protein
MAFRVICAALLLSSLPVAGCGTVTNVARQRPEAGGNTPFGGVRQDMLCIRKAANGEYGSRTHSKSESEQYPEVALMLFCAADLPLSLLGDVVTWPYTVAYNFINQPVPVPPVMLTHPPALQTLPTTTMPMPLPTPPAMQGPGDGQPPVVPPLILPKLPGLP